jgi:hypothetical protein
MYLAGHRDAAVPGTIISVALFTACFGLSRFVDRIDPAKLSRPFEVI